MAAKMNQNKKKRIFAAGLDKLGFIEAKVFALDIPLLASLRVVVGRQKKSGPSGAALAGCLQGYAKPA
jgi:hypothetical protein